MIPYFVLWGPILIMIICAGLDGRWWK